MTAIYPGGGWSQYTVRWDQTGSVPFPGPAPIVGEITFPDAPGVSYGTFAISTRILGACPPAGSSHATMHVLKT
jgi:hypothetical protein